MLAGTVSVTTAASSETFAAVRVAARPLPLVFGTVPVVAKSAPPAQAAKQATVAALPEKPAPAAVRTTAYRPAPAVMASSSGYVVPEGESRVYRLAQPVSRVAVGNPEVADFIMLGPSQLYLSGKKNGTTNLILWDRSGNVTARLLQVTRNITPVRELLRAALPEEDDIRVYARGSAVVLAGSVSDAVAAETAYRLVKGYMGGTLPDVNPESSLVDSAAASSGAASISGLVVAGTPSAASGAGTTVSTGIRGVVNLLKIRDPQQVRLEVHIAEVSRSYLQSLGLGWKQGRGKTQGSLMTGFVSNATLDLLLKTDGAPNSTVGNRLQMDAERKTALIKILAEPTIVTMSGKEGYFLVGGKIYTPTVSTNGAVDYVERTYGVGLRCTPTVLDAGRISLKVAPEVSEPNSEPITAGTQMNLPAFKVSYASTTVQMKEGENLVIGGLLRDNLTEVIRAFPLLGDLPLLGTLFRHTEKNSETTELLVVVSPTLVKAGTEMPELPTDRFVPPSRSELFIEGKLDGSRRVQ
jgi:pilus assembly protein CpaC